MARQMPGWLAQLGRQAETALGDPDRPYRRPGSPHLMTAAQWDTYDRYQALRERQVARFGDEFAARMGGGLGWTRGRVLL